ncbi:FeoA family protein [Algihabitans albus]|uniref:FeoA family protein n=1 Tax=Algihabitans albus TaxID=2164067 RepID=UPI000E5C7ED7|nr:FeoA family protein [Algihabitans albus]
MPPTSRAAAITAEGPPLDRSLAGVPQGRTVRIDSLHAGQVTNRRLTELGLCSGTLVEVLQNHGRDGVIVGLGSERLALPRSLAVRVWIAECPEVAGVAGGTAS